MKLTDLQAGDILLYRSASTNWIDRLISWGEWSNKPGEADEYVHAGLVLAPMNNQGFEMNPPASHYTILSQQPWDRIDVWRLTVPINTVGLRGWCALDLGTPYPFAKYARFTGAALLARIGLPSLAHALEDGGGQTSAKWAVCSATVALALQANSNGVALWNENPEDERPCDIPLGLHIAKVGTVQV